MTQIPLALQGYRCFLCHFDSVQKETICPECQGVHTMARKPEPHEDVQNLPTISRRAKRASTISADLVEKIQTGNVAWDKALDGGLVRPSSMLVCGKAGVGKSTQAIAIAAHIGMLLDEPVLYGSAEMPDELFAHIARNRLNLKKEALDNIYVTDTNDLASMLADVDDIEPCMIIWDSMQRFRAEGEEGDVVLRKVVHDAIEIGKEHNAITMLVSQITKGDDFAGRNTIRHDVDCVVDLVKVKTGISVQVLDKNRWGRTPLAGVIPVSWSELETLKP